MTQQNTTEEQDFDKLAAALANPAAHGLGGFGEFGIRAGAGAAIHANGKSRICHAMKR